MNDLFAVAEKTGLDKKETVEVFETMQKIIAGYR
jgi:hypothetical protein